MPYLWRVFINILLIRYFMAMCVMIHEELSYNPNSYSPFDQFYPTLTNAPSKKYSSSSNSKIRPIIEQLSKSTHNNNDGNYNYTNWATLLSNAHHLSFKDTTIFIPDDDAVVKPMLFHYHIASQRFTYTELVYYTHTWTHPSPLYFDPRPLLNPGARVPTLARGRNLFFTVVDDEDGSTLAVNGVLITRPNLYQGAKVCVHGIKNPLELPSFDTYDTPDVDATSTLWFRALFVIYTYYFLRLVRDLRVLGMRESAWFVVAVYIVDFVDSFIVAK